MNIISKAHNEDANGNTKKAIALYEDAIGKKNALITDYLNLICLYFLCMDFGYSTAKKVGKDIERIASSRALELTEEAISIFGVQDELIFWKNYIPYIGWGDDFQEPIWRGDSLIPYIYIALENPTTENIEKALKLYRDISSMCDSERKRFLASKLEAIFRRNGINF